MIKDRSTVITLASLLIVLLVLSWFTYRAYVKNTAVETLPSAALEALTTSSSSAGFTTMSGEPVALDSYIGSVIVVHSWASWDPTSPEILKELASLQDQYEADGVRIVGINRAEPAATATTFLDFYDLSDVELVLDTDDQFFANIDGRTMPETIFYASDGSVVHHAKRALAAEELAYWTTQAIRRSE